LERQGFRILLSGFRRTVFTHEFGVNSANLTLKVFALSAITGFLAGFFPDRPLPPPQ